jgi:hypothetical protein
MSWFSRFQGAVDGVAGIGAGVIAAKGGLKARIASMLASPAGQRDVMAVLRFAKPRLHLKQNIVKCYSGDGTLLLTRAADFHARIERQAEFEVVYGPRMRMLT